MSCVSKEKYASYLERLVRVTHSQPVDRDAYVQLITEICKDYKLTKGMTEFYITPMMEQRGLGEVFCDFDNGKSTKVLLRIRIISTSKAVIIGTLYSNPDEYVHEDVDVQQLDSMLRIILGYVSRVRLIKKLEEFGFSDLDGYRNFRAFARFMDVNNAENKLGGKVSFYIDLHNFTLINQEIGRENGDIVMRKYYELLSDTIGDTGIIIRLGGDRFIGVFDRGVQDDVFRIFSGANIAYDVTGQQRVNVSVAAGIYALPTPYMLKSYGDIMDKIMLAGNVAKRHDGERIVTYGEKMKAESDHVKMIQSAFMGAIKNEEFIIHYQPKVDIETKQIVGAEALCRWQRDGRVIPPDEFIPILELNTFVSDLDFYVLDHVCRDMVRWLNEGRKPVRVSVNFSRKHLVDIDLTDHIITIIDKYNIPHDLIEIELTETTSDVMFSDLRRIVSSLQREGVKTAVDDFGVGYSSLNLIRDIPWDVLKIDKSFVPEAEDEVNVSNVMFRHLISLAHDMGLECVVEGVETDEQLRIMRKNGCRIAQGFFFDHPLSVDEFEDRLVNKAYK
jgi:EAL domain-containing protein (putative c-di-GMP-specific phosphodiesterase class I)/GGDEF domain-containing protein